MLTTAQVGLPAPVEARLKNEAAYSEDVHDYAREDLIGFKRPLAAAFALVAPFTLAVIGRASGLADVTIAALIIAGVLVFGLVIVGKLEWPNIVARFQHCAMVKRRAAADLRCGFGESSFLSNSRAPRFFEHENGVLVLADAGDFKTLFFDVDKSGGDPRWALYLNGGLNRKIWRWLRLPVSRELLRFSTEGSKIEPSKPPMEIRSIDAWEAINVALGEPLDGAVIHRPFDEVTEAVERLN